MIYFLDVNVLLALLLREHEFTDRVALWIQSLDRKRDQLGTCSIVEIGFVRIFPQITEHAYSVGEAQALLARFKAASDLPVTLYPDHLGADQLPIWVKKPAQTTDGHLIALACAHGAVFATLDHKIQGAFLIPA